MASSDHPLALRFFLNHGYNGFRHALREPPIIIQIDCVRPANFAVLKAQWIELEVQRLRRTIDELQGPCSLGGGGSESCAQINIVQPLDQRYKSHATLGNRGALCAESKISSERIAFMQPLSGDLTLLVKVRCVPGATHFDGKHDGTSQIRGWFGWYYRQIPQIKGH